MGQSSKLREDASDSHDPAFVMIDDAYVVSTPRKSWFVVCAAPSSGMPERTRQFIERLGHKAYWPRRLRVVSRGNGARKKDVTLVSNVLSSYVLVHLPEVPDFGRLTGDEAQFYGVAGLLRLADSRAPERLPDVHVERLIDRERGGEFNETTVKRNKRVSKFPDWCEPGALVRVIDGPFASFLAIVETLDEEKSRVEVLVEIFGRATICDLELPQIECVRYLPRHGA